MKPFVGLCFLISLALLFGPCFLFAPFWERLILHIAGGAGVLLTAVLALFTKLWIKASASRALYVTGQGKPKAIIDGGLLAVPFINDITPVTLETHKLKVVRQGDESLICRDFLRADVAAEFYIRVNKTAEGVKAAATSLGQSAANPEAIRVFLTDKLVSALRSVAANMTLAELHQDREAFAMAVQQAVAREIELNGFFLESVTVSHLDQSDVNNLKDRNVFDAVGLSKVTEILECQRVRKKRIEKEADLAIAEEERKASEKLERLCLPLEPDPAPEGPEEQPAEG